MIFNKIATITLVSTAMLAGVCIAPAASASLIASFDYTVDSAFAAYDFTSGTGSTVVTHNGQGYYNGEATQLAWGSSAHKSSVAITPEVSGTVATGETADGATFTHNNQAIPDSSKTLSAFKLATKLTLTANSSTSATGTRPNIAPIVFDSFFKETPNDAPCGFQSTSTCDDIFVLTNGNSSALHQGQTFSLDGNRYRVMLDIMNLGRLTGSQCQQAGAASGCIGFTTQEDKNNLFTSSFTIAAIEAVPEPSDLALLGLSLGLIGFGLFVRRRHSLRA